MLRLQMKYTEKNSFVNNVSMTLEMLLLLQKMAFWEGWKSQKSLQSQKMRFFQNISKSRGDFQ